MKIQQSHFVYIFKRLNEAKTTKVTSQLFSLNRFQRGLIKKMHHNISNEGELGNGGKKSLTNRKLKKLN